MGCDIHVWMEVRDRPDQDWRKIPEIFKTWNDQPTDEPFGDRNYRFFSVLADVRNGRGFAGVETGSYIEPLPDAPRGLPEDVTPEGKKLSDEYGVDGHSQSWCTLRELIDYNWSAPYSFTGVVTAEQYEALQGGEEPTSWSGGTSGPGIVTISEAQYADFKRIGVLPKIVEISAFPRHFPDRVEFEGGVPGPDTRIYVQARWPSKGGVEHAVGEELVAKIRKWGECWDPDNTRFVFFFDN